MAEESSATEAQETLLYSARHGELDSKARGNLTLDVNCKVKGLASVSSGGLGFAASEAQSRLETPPRRPGRTAFGTWSVCVAYFVSVVGRRFQHHLPGITVCVELI
ncbi:hypothetical protein K1T71_000003 [Dendrolimus kikuchii]|uniref:Uncharacterized protein n=1 Tax=Dendrolimus kikuchii TaxID=765133 RepID=A0ACC1DIF8_9NEOP|nr:hypothetical protein K1T71_000003 [Dendrolimus kikuchii]